MSRRPKAVFLLDPPDPSVGLFGDLWYHDDCPVDPDGQDADAVIISTRSRLNADNLHTTFTHRMRCRACGATGTATEVAFTGEGLPED